ncbi:MAG: hypothetical protein L0322_29110, partial [Chloroflexi bacterium]|nr:hypothetical protein [Chloroflexota bacterium]
MAACRQTEATPTPTLPPPPLPSPYPATAAGTPNPPAGGYPALVTVTTAAGSLAIATPIPAAVPATAAS